MSAADETRSVTRQPPPAAAGPANAVTPALAVRPPAASGTLQVQRRAARMLARTVPQVRYQLARVGPAGMTGLGVLAAAAIAAVVLLMPAQQSLLALRDELSKSGGAIPEAARPDQTPGQFAASLPTRAEIPALLGVLLVQATDAGIALDQGKYVYSPAGANHLAHYTFEFPVKGDYGSIRSFIDKSLVAIPALGLDKLHVERKNVGDITVNADVGFVIYLRGA
jgi:hypothetical protein